LAALCLRASVVFHSVPRARLESPVALASAR